MWKISHGDISATAHPIQGRIFWIGGSNGAISGSIKSKMAARGRQPHLGKFRMNNLWNGLSDPLS